MQIRLTVLAPHSGQNPGRTCDVLVTAPAGTALSAVASALASAVAGPEDSLGGGAIVLYAGHERLDAQRCALGEPPLVDGAALSLRTPGEDESADGTVPAQLHVIAGPDAGGVHLLHGGQVRIGRSADADVPLDDPDVSRLHCAVTVSGDGRVSVVDLGSTNGTSLDGTEVRDRPVPLAPGALLRLGESTLRLMAGTRTPTLPTAPDGEGHLRVSRADAGDPSGATGDDVAGGGHGYAYGRAQRPAASPSPHPSVPGGDDAYRADVYGPDDVYGDGPAGAVRHSTHAEGTRFVEGEPPRRGIGAWARRLTGGKGDAGHEGEPGDSAQRGAPEPAARSAGPSSHSLSASSSAPAGTWPDPAAVLLTALGPGPRLWERDASHPEALVVRLGTTDRADLPAVPVTVGLREAGSLGLAGPRTRLAGLARSTVAQLAALHSPFDLEIVLISTDRSRGTDERRREWAWLGWLPHLRPMRGQDCRLLLAYDREQATARTAELVRRLDEGPLGPGWAGAGRSAVAEAAHAYSGPHTVVIVDGDPGTAALRETTAGLAGAGAAAGIHLICLAETPAASPTSPVAATYEAACRASIAFRECGAVAMLSGDVATALRLLRTAGGQAAGHGTVAAVDAVSAAWAERFGRALAPLRDEGSATLPGRPTAAALPPSARLLDELGLARATPASLMARWASTADAQPGATVRTAAPVVAEPDPTGSGRTLSTGPRVGPQRTGPTPHPRDASTGTDHPHSGRTPHPTTTGSGRTPYPGTDTGSGRTPYPGTAPGSGRTPYPGTDTSSGRTPYPGTDTGSGRTPYPGTDTSSGRTPYPGTGATGSGRTPYPATDTGSGRTPYPGSGSTDDGRAPSPYPDTGTSGSGRTPYPRTATGSGRTPYPGPEAASAGHDHTLHLGGNDRTTSHRATDTGTDHGPYPDATTTGSGRTPYPGTRRSAGSTASGRGSYPGAESADSRRVPGDGSDTRGGGEGALRAGDPGARSGAGRTAYSTGAAARVGGQRRDSPDGVGHATVQVGRPVIVLGAGPRGALSVDLADEGPHLLIEGPAGSGRTELLRAVAASLAAAARPDRLGILLVDGAGGERGERGEGLRPCTELPHVFGHLVASDPLRMREFAQALGGELKRRAELLGGLDFAEWHAQYEASQGLPGRRATAAEQRGDSETPAGGTLRLRPAATRAVAPDPSPLPRLVVLADDFDALVAPSLGSPGRPAAGSVVRALEAVARDGGRLGVHLVATSARPDRTEDTELARGGRLRIVLDAPAVPQSPDEPAPGRGRLGHPDGRVTPFQGGRVTGRIPRTATLRPTVVPLEWERMGDPPTRRPVRELGNGPTDLALLASALERAARSVNAERLPPLIPFSS